MLNRILLAIVFAIAASVNLPVVAQQAPAPTPPPNVPMPPRGIPQQAQTPDSSAKIDELMEGEFQRGLRVGQQIQAAMQAKQQEINDLATKCGDRCTPPKPVEPPKAPEKK
jgi:hypothetical protein